MLDINAIIQPFLTGAARSAGQHAISALSNKNVARTTWSDHEFVVRLKKDVNLLRCDHCGFFDDPECCRLGLAKIAFAIFKSDAVGYTYVHFQKKTTHLYMRATCSTPGLDSKFPSHELPVGIVLDTVSNPVSPLVGKWNMRANEDGSMSFGIEHELFYARYGPEALSSAIAGMSVECWRLGTKYKRQ